MLRFYWELGRDITARNDENIYEGGFYAALSRDNFLNTYLNPAVKEGFVALLYLDSPRHPRQKYLLTVRGWTVYKNLKQ